MRDMIKQVLDFAAKCPHIRIVGMEGSRINKNVPKDEFQDFDITYFVDDIGYFTQNDNWLTHFGTIIMMQKPEDMELFPPEQPGYSYLILFDDYCKLDLTLLEKQQINDYLQQDKLRTILLDKDGIIPEQIIPSDIDYWIHRPSARSFDDCCNEFWNLTPYVVKGLCRKEILFAIDHLSLMKRELLRMLSWKIGTERGFDFSLGKNYKYLAQYIKTELWEALLSTYCTNSYKTTWQALFQCHSLFRAISQECAEKMGFPYPLSYDKNISKYTEDMYQKYNS